MGIYVRIDSQLPLNETTEKNFNYMETLNTRNSNCIARNKKKV